jgi:hypothetical protein
MNIWERTAELQYYLNFLLPYMIYSQIWLILHVDDCQFGYITKLQKLQPWLGLMMIKKTNACRLSFQKAESVNLNVKFLPKLILTTACSQATTRFSEV